MILENPYHRRKVKKILQKNKQLLAENAELKAVIASTNKVNYEEIIDEQIDEIRSLKKKIQGYKMQLAKYKKRS